MEFIDLKTQQKRIRKEIESRVAKVLDHGQYILGPEITELEEKLARFVGVKHCISNSNGTDALLLPLIAAGIGLGDEVITTPFTFFATGEMISLAGAKPVFVDIDPQTYNIDAGLITKAITSKTKAIMPVSLYGQCPDLDLIMGIAEKHKLLVIEDAAQSFGAEYHGNKSCSITHVGATSFFPSKPLGGYGDSGACFTNNDSLAKTMKELRVHGQEKRYYHTRIGINGRMDTMQAAILLPKLEIFPEEVDLRKKWGSLYKEMLGSSFKFQSLPSHSTSVYAQFTIEVDDRDGFIKKMAEFGVPTAVHYPIPLHLQPVYKELGFKEGDFPHAEKAAHRVVSLPMHPYLNEELITKVVKAVKASVNG